MTDQATLQVLAADQAEVIDTEWGQLTWWASAELGNSPDMTVGRCILKPGMANPLHSHPNCSEVLVVMQGRITHTVDAVGNDVEMGPGDTISASPNVLHRARNIGDEEAILFIAFSSADRQTQGE